MRRTIEDVTGASVTSSSPIDSLQFRAKGGEVADGGFQNGPGMELHTYRFVVPGGNYVVATHEGTGSKPVPVVARSGQTTHANIPSSCK
jgi:hypothetical protein